MRKHHLNFAETMSQATPESPPKLETPRDQAAHLVNRLQELTLDVEAAREQTDKRPPRERIKALLADAQSLAEGLSTGAITMSQPRMATNLVEVATQLEDAGHYPLAAEFTRLIRWMSVGGLAAENCSLGRDRLISAPKSSPMP